MNRQAALVVIDLQNDITKNYRSIIDQVNRAIEWACNAKMDRIGFAVLGGAGI